MKQGYVPVNLSKAVVRTFASYSIACALVLTQSMKDPVLVVIGSYVGKPNAVG